MNILKILLDAAAHSEHGLLLKCGIGPELAERSQDE
jgi:hypothetical protein